MYNGKIIVHKYGTYVLLVVDRDSCDSVDVYQAFSLDFKNRLWRSPITENQVREKYQDDMFYFEDHEDPKFLVYRSV